MKYRAEIDGLRALAVVPVILFHAGFELFSGGFVGVDVFFVISGYLITTILIEDIENNRFSIVNFYERRARRILPALFFVMLVCLPFAWMWMLPSQMKDFSVSIFSVSLFLSNFHFMSEVNYFAPSAELSPLLHTWSLAIEEQFYLFFPPLLLLCFKRSRKFALFMIFIISVASFVFSEWAWRKYFEENFFFSFSRFWELFVGSIAAFIVQHKGVQKNNVLASLGLAAIIFSIFTYDESTPFPSVYALVPVLGVVLLILYADKDTLIAKLLSTRAFVGIGLISYSAYLWHQPLFAFARIRVHEPNDFTFAVLSIVSLLLAALSWKYVERPFRYHKGLPKKQSAVFIYSIIALVTFSIIGFIGYINNGFQDVTQTRKELAELTARIGVNYGMSSMCEGDFNLSEECANSDSPTLLLWGDSFAMHLYQGISASNPSLKIRQITTSACSPIIGISNLKPNKNRGFDWANRCLNFNDSAFKWLKQNNTIELVVLSSPFGWVGKEQVIDTNGHIFDPDVEFILSSFLQTIQKIKSLGVGVVVVSPTPRSDFNIGRCLVKEHQFNSAFECDFAYSESSYNHEFLSAVEQSESVYWLHNDICKDGLCSAQEDNTFIYRDAGHLSKEGSAFLGISNNWYANLRELALTSIMRPLKNDPISK